MKKFFAILCLGLFILPAFCQELSESDVPKPVMESFQAKYPKVVKSVWEQSKKGDYKVRFSETGAAKAKAIFTAEGEWQRTETRLKGSELSEKISAYLLENYKGFGLKAAFLVEQKDKEPLFQLKVVNKSDETMKKLIFDKEGAFVKEAGRRSRR